MIDCFREKGIRGSTNNRCSAVLALCQRLLFFGLLTGGTTSVSSARHGPPPKVQVTRDVSVIQTPDGFWTIVLVQNRPMDWPTSAKALGHWYYGIHAESARRLFYRQADNCPNHNEERKSHDRDEIAEPEEADF